MRIRPRSEDIEEDEFELEDLKEKRLEMRRLRAERDLLRMKAELERTKAELNKYATASTPDISTNTGGQSTAVGAMIASLVKAGVKPEEANDFLTKMSPESLATLSALTSNNPYLPIFMFLASQSKGTSPQSLGPKDVIELNKSVYELAQNISGGKSGSSSETQGVLKELASAVKDLYNKQLLDKLEDIASRVSVRSSVWDEILEDEKKFQRFRELFGGGGTNPEIQLKLEELRQQHEKEMRKLDLEMLKLRSEMIEKKRRNKVFAEGLRKIGQAIGEGLEGATGETFQYQQKQLAPRPESLKCPKCGSDIPNAQPGSIVECPSCHTKYEVRERT